MKYDELFNTIRGRVAEEYPKEYLCHLQFVLTLARELQKIKGGDLEVVEIAAIAHDIGRKEGADNKLHPEKGSARIIEWAQELRGFDSQQIEKLGRCALMHGKNLGFKSIEEQITSNADALSKLRYHENFMLMCKKEDYLEKAQWGLKHVEKGYNNLSFPDVAQAHQELYRALVEKYQKVLGGI